MILSEHITRTDILVIQECFKKESTNNINARGYKLETLLQLKNTFKSLRKKMYFVNLVNYYIEDNKKPTKIQIKKCIPFCKWIIKKSKPEFVVLLGSTTYNSLIGTSKFKSWVGRMVKKDGVKYIPIYHPDYAIKSKVRQREYNSQIKNAVVQISRGEKKIKIGNYELITNEKKICEKLKELSNSKSIQSFDYETTSIIPENGVPICLSISDKIGRAYVLYFFDIDEWKNYGVNKKLTDNIKNSIRMWMKSSVQKVAQQAKFEIKWTIRHFNCEPNNIINDTKQLQHLIDENTQDRLTDLAYQYTNMGGYDSEMQKFLDDGHEHWQCEPDKLLKYAGGDADVTLRVHYEQQKLLKDNKKILWLKDNIIIPLVYTLARIENRGIKLNWDSVNIVYNILNNEIDGIKNKLNNNKHIKNTLHVFLKNNKRLKEVNFNSSPQMKHLLYKELRLPVIKRSKKTGEPSTDSKTLDKLKDKSDIVNYIVKMRSYNYQLNDLETILNKVRKDYTVFSDLIQEFVVTGRISSRNPNLQNIRGGTDDEPSLIKRCFCSRFSGGILLQADYRQLELRLVGSESNEIKFINAFKNNVDMHDLTATEIFDIDMDEYVMNKEKYKPCRTYAKRINFGTVYGITEHGLSEQIGCTIPEAKEKLEKYWNVYSSIKKWTRNNEKEAVKKLYVTNKFGRIRHLPEVLDNRWWIKESALRQASNFKIQSLGADITNWSVINIDKMLINLKLKSCVIGQIHDSVLVDMHPDEKQIVIDVVNNIMVNRANNFFSFLRIPLSIDIEIGENWNDMEKI